MFRRTWGVVVAAVLVAGAWGCGDDDGGGVVADASTTDAALDAGMLVFEAELQDLITNANLCEVTMADANDTGRSTRSAPNGRAILSLPGTGVHELRATREGVAAAECSDDLLPHLQTVDSEAAALHRPAAFPYKMVTAADADTFVSALPGVAARDAAATQLFVAVRTEPGGSPLTGAQVSLGDPGDGAFVRNASGDFAAGDTLGTDDTVLFANVPVGTATIAVTTPGGETCTGPSSIRVEAGISSVFFSCQ